MPIYVPREIVPLQPSVDSPLLFLAGPIRGGGDWQSSVAERIFKHKPDALITCPSRWTEKHRLAHHFHQPFSQATNRQLEWERHYLKQAGLEAQVHGCVIFWLPIESNRAPHPGPEPYAMDTRREIGKFTAYAEERGGDRVRIVVGGSQNFYGLDVILFELRQAFGETFHFHITMEGVIRQALSIACRE